MTQQERPRTSYGRNLHRNFVENSVDNKSEVAVEPRLNFAERPSSRRSVRKTPMGQHPQPMIHNPPASPVDVVEDEDIQQRRQQQQFIPHPPAMPQREETFVQQQQQHQVNTSPRRRRYSAAKRDAEYDEHQLHEKSFLSMDNDVLPDSPKRHSQQQNIRKTSSMYSNESKPVVTKNFKFQKDPIDFIVNESPDRPVSSRLSRFSAPLPPISHSKPPPLTAANSNNTTVPIIIGKQQPAQQRQDDGDTEPNESDANSLLIAIRLPNGETLKRCFLKTDLVLNIIKYASKKSNIDFLSEDIKLLEMPKNNIHDFKMSIEYYGLKNRTMLHIVYNSRTTNN